MFKMRASDQKNGKKNTMKSGVPENIVEAYGLAAKAFDSDPLNKQKIFEDVISFCENDVECKADDSLKRNTLLLWAYDKLAMAKFDASLYAEALAIWQKSYKLALSSKTKINIGNKMLEAVEKANMKMSEKAKNIVKITAFLHKAYSDEKNQEAAERIQRLQNVAAFVLGESKSTH